MPTGSSLLTEVLHRLSTEGDPGLLARGRFGLEKESLRVAESGGIALTPHPAALGAALTHPHITTDYSEALLELVTPPFEDFTQALDCLEELHLYVHGKLEQEFLWATSMPCILAGGDAIPIATYGSSNPGMMKYVYRVGLGNRYGRTMQVIAGVHYNFSLDESFWPMYQNLLGENGDPGQFRDRHYMGMVRNLQRYGWLIPYLFGASPAVCKSFFTDKEPDLLVFDDTTYYEPYATSLRMGDIGYQNRKEEGMGIKASYDDLSSYVSSLARATCTPCPVWEAIGVKVDGEYRQLNANQLQIENEYYSSVRPKQICADMETPAHALQERGIEYVELRSLDVNAYHPLGVDETQLRFLHVFMLYCLLRESPAISCVERKEIDRNLIWVAHQGRDPLLKLQRGGRAVLFRDWARELLQAMEPLAELLGEQGSDGKYEASLNEQQQKLDDAALTPSGRMLDEMRENGEGFYQFARRLSREQWRYFASRQIDPVFEQQLQDLAEQSMARQLELEQASGGSFDAYLERYFAGQI
ncbi:glutamate--cysteine ligase [Thiolapillus brandeum]|uniref:Glutamate--cysteine ligase n=1 Tax=Thiolapillus brandeum TaxID=1076588 RepID=A0A7U6GKA9_9GAMM|nr:glutamate--cysteine ligase [Thiolapillus brandeum]BAO45169.1 glutamate---cysteine ligase [Thiolapillus brandeum]